MILSLDLNPWMSETIRRLKINLNSNRSIRNRKTKSWLIQFFIVVLIFVFHCFLSFESPSLVRPANSLRRLQSSTLTVILATRIDTNDTMKPWRTSAPAYEISNIETVAMPIFIFVCCDTCRGPDEQDLHPINCRDVFYWAYTTSLHHMAYSVGECGYPAV